MIKMNPTLFQISSISGLFTLRLILKPACMNYVFTKAASADKFGTGTYIRAAPKFVSS